MDERDNYLVVELNLDITLKGPFDWDALVKERDRLDAEHENNMTFRMLHIGVSKGASIVVY